VVIGKKKNNAPIAGTSKAPKKVPLIDLSDNTEVCDFNFLNPVFYISFISMFIA
jgi:hypothetical protein